MIESPNRPEPPELPDEATPATGGHADQRRGRVAGMGLLSGLCLAASVPPWGWWPLAFVGIAMLDRLVADQPWRSRFRRTWLVSVAWLYPAMLWMFDLTAPGYVVAGAFYAAYFGLAAALTPAGPGRRLVLPGAVALAEAARWSWPFGGVPLANLALSQVETPLLWSSRLGGSLLVVVLVVVGGQALSAAVERAWRPALIGFGVLVLFVAGGAIHPRATVVDEIEVALVQGGGAQRTRASVDQQPVVLGRHLEASARIEEAVDLVVWPENVVNPGRYLDRGDAFADIAGLAGRLDAPILAGWFFPVSDTASANFQSIINPDGTETDRYDKVRIVPFGEFVPLRGLIEAVAPNSGIPRRDVQVGTLDAVLETPVGPVGVSISWEGFFDTRARAAVQDGAQVLTNPTNGSSYWLTQVQTQQIASNQLRAVENDRWMLQVAPTGFSAVVDADGNVLQRTEISERAVLISTAEMRQGRTLATIVGRWPVVLYGLIALAAAQVVASRGRSEGGQPATAHQSA